MNFKGNSLCLFPDDNKNCYPGFYPKGLQDLSGTINSARKGCYKTKESSTTSKTFSD